MSSERRWFQSYDTGVPRDVEIPPNLTLDKIFTDTCQKYGAKISFINMGRGISFRNLNRKVMKLASYFQNELGLKKGDKLAIQLPNLLQYPIVLFAAFRAGLTVVNINPLFTPNEMLAQFKDARVKAIVILENFIHKLDGIKDLTNIEHVLCTRVGDFLYMPKKYIVHIVIKYFKKAIPKYRTRSIWLRQAIKKGNVDKFTQPKIEAEDIAFLQYTGGTTGNPRAAILTHRNIIANIKQIEAWFGEDKVNESDLVCSPLPFYHIFSLTVNCLAFFNFGCSNVIITNPKDVPSVIKDLKKFPITVITGVNTLFNVLLRHRQFHRISWNRYRFIVAGGAPLQTAVAEEFKVRTGKRILEGYGLTEASPLVCCNPLKGVCKPGTIGLPMPSTVVSIIDENGESLPIGKAGEIAVEGPQVMRGYWLKEEDTASVIRNGKLLTGDIGMMDEDGYIRIVDRKKDLILVSGFNVYPNEVEDVLATHSAIIECAVIGVSDSKTGERPVAVIVKKEGEPIGGRELRMYCKRYLTNYKIPKDFLFVKELPKSNVGKILRRAVREKILKNGFERG